MIAGLLRRETEGGTFALLETPRVQSTAPLWRNSNFRLLFSAQIISLLGSGVTTVGLALFAYQLTGGSSATAVIGNALMLRILAFLLFSQPVGVIADRVSRKKILIAADLLRFWPVRALSVHYRRVAGLRVDLRHQCGHSLLHADF
jgi:hypothetical protein